MPQSIITSVIRSREAGNQQDIILSTRRAFHILHFWILQEISVFLLVLLEVMEKMGAQFQHIELMLTNNSEMVKMINRKVFQDYVVSEKEISGTIRNLGEVSRTWRIGQKSRRICKKRNGQIPRHLQLAGRLIFVSSMNSQLLEMEKLVKSGRERAQGLLGCQTAAEGSIREIKAGENQFDSILERSLGDHSLSQIFLASIPKQSKQNKKDFVGLFPSVPQLSEKDLSTIKMRETTKDRTVFRQEVCWEKSTKLCLKDSFLQLTPNGLKINSSKAPYPKRSTQLSMNRTVKVLKKIVIKDFQSKGQPPQLLWVKEMLSKEGEFIIDENVSFHGKILMKISKAYNTFISIPGKLEISIEEFYSVVRLCFIVNELGCSWFSYVGEPILKVIVILRVGQFQINLQSVICMFQRIFIKKLKENIDLVKKKISIPLEEKDVSYEIIHNRFRMGMEGQPQRPKGRQPGKSRFFRQLLTPSDVNRQIKRIKKCYIINQCVNPILAIKGSYPHVCPTPEGLSSIIFTPQKRKFSLLAGRCSFSPQPSSISTSLRLPPRAQPRPQPPGRCWYAPLPPSGSPGSSCRTNIFLQGSWRKRLMIVLP